MNVVLLCRVSTNSQDYDRQVQELTAHCHSAGWNIVRVFANKVSGAKKLEEWTEIVELLEFVNNNKVDRVCVIEISRLRRNTLEALKVILLLNENGVCLYIKTIAERLASGRSQYIARGRAEGKKMGRPSNYRKSDEAMKERYSWEI